MRRCPTAVFESFDPLYRPWSCVLENPLVVHLARSLSEVLPLLQEADRAAHSGLCAALMLSYEAAPAFDAAMEVHALHDFPLGWLAVFREPSPRVYDSDLGASQDARWKPLIAYEAYDAAIASIRSAIARGDCYQVNYTFPMECQFLEDAWSWYRWLGRSQGAGYSAWLNLGRYRVLSSPRNYFLSGADVR